MAAIAAAAGVVAAFLVLVGEDIARHRRNRESTVNQGDQS